MGAPESGTLSNPPERIVGNIKAALTWLFI